MATNYVEDIMNEEAEQKEFLQRKRQLKALNKELINRILDKAMSIGYVEHIEELTNEINRRTFLNMFDKPLMLRGFLVALNEVEYDETLKGKNLFHTLLVVKETLFKRHRHNTANKDLSYVSLAIAHMKLRNGVRR